MSDHPSSGPHHILATPTTPETATTPPSDLYASSPIPRNPSRSRFLVNKVAGEADVPATPEQPASPEINILSEPLTPITPRGVHFNVGTDKSPTPTDHEQHTMGNAGTYGTANFKSFQAVQTLEKIPHVDHYRNIMSVQGAMAARPTLQELHDEEAQKNHEDKHMQHFERFDQLETGKGLEAADNLKPTIVGQKFGWIQGVLMRCVLSILGTILYLRISWVAGAAGIGFGTLIVLLSAVVIVITCISMCAICTNGEIKGGGAYYMISRSLGPEFGGAIGLIFSFANVVSSAMCVVGFAEVVRDMMKNEHQVVIVDGEVNDVRIIGYATLALLLCVVIVGVSFESKAQLVLLVVLGLSLIDYLIGTFIPPDEDKQAKGMTGYSLATLVENFYPDWRDQNFFSVFAVFFPACTGIMAGANISGDLADPQKAIPKGTLIAIAICMFLYVGAIWTTGATFVRDAVGNFNASAFILTELSNSTVPAQQYGLWHNFQIMEISGAWRPLVTAGIFAATLSSALAGFVSAPKVFQAVCKDRLFPGIHVFAKGYGNSDEPRRGYVLAFIIAVAVTSIGSLNVIAPVISNFFLMSYALVNYACFDASFAASPGFRPGFRYYNMWVSLLGAILCMAVMFIISWWNALITFGFVAALYVYVLHRKPDVNWGSSTQAHAYKDALQSAQKLALRQEHVKNYRPQILILTGNPVARPALVDFASNITKDNSLLICGHVLPLQPTAWVLASIDRFSRQLYQWFEKRKVKAFYVGVARPNMRQGVQCILQVAGLGKLKPNVVLLGCKNNWRETFYQDQSNDDYFNIIHDAFENNCGVGILRLQNGLDVSGMMSEHNVGDTQNLKLPEPSFAANIDSTGSGTNLTDSNRQLTPEPQQALRSRQGGSESSFGERLMAIVKNSRSSLNKSNTSDVSADGEEKEGAASKLLNEEMMSDQEEVEVEEEEEGVEKRVDDDDDSPTQPPASYMKRRRMTKQQKEILQIIDQFKIKVKKPIVHVYWLFDDGGLGLLVPHLLTIPRSYLENSKLSVFTVAASRSQLEKEQRSMAALLSRFRIEYSDVFVIPDLAKRPQQETIHEFEDFIAPFREPKDMITPVEEKTEDGKSSSRFITNAEYLALRAKTYRQLRIREILLQHSCEATMIVVTLPVPRRGILTSTLYLAWLDFMTRSLPPVLLLRGNQQSVLTFYS